MKKPAWKKLKISRQTGVAVFDRSPLGILEKKRPDRFQINSAREFSAIGDPFWISVSPMRAFLPMREVGYSLQSKNGRHQAAGGGCGNVLASS